MAGRGMIDEAVFGSYRFNDPALLQQALTHRSAGAPHYERLEFLGDGVVNLIVAELLYTRWPKADEGTLTRARAELVRESALASVARELQLGARIRFGPGEMKSGGHRRDSILADALEAVIGAIWLDSDFATCRSQVLPWFATLLEALPPPNRIGKDAKTRLQEWLQARQLALPVYELLAESGDDHAKRFLMRCSLVEPPVSAEGEGSARRAAEQAAAEAVLAQLEAGA